MDRTDGIVKLSQQVVRIIERTVGQNVDLRGLENTNAVQASIELVGKFWRVTQESLAPARSNRRQMATNDQRFAQCWG